ncbi:acyltransferase [Congregibacter litoralis]|uniref:Bacterial transferase hexapeptide (Six repeat proteins) n=1 Tax=Congregibacter litoralis KT71 TaxID=314285 RepID=A4A570_9GAMM|nr:acyltransferase [Congregibacter litoralis]EAQ98941.1 Bacterial transferase hexapeptide (six repeat proteins) [Congregibacter litoralis KT71]
MKILLKSVMRALSIVTVSPLLFIDLLLRPIAGDGAFAACSQFLSLFPGKTGSYLRVAFYRMAMRSCAEDTYIGFGTLFSQRDTVIGSGVYIGPQCNIGSCHIGKDTLIASGVHIMSGTGQHRFDDLETPIRDQGGQFDMISIGEDCWIGNAALVMADVGDGSVIGAGSVVTKDVDPMSIAAGHPARVLRSRIRDAATET